MSAAIAIRRAASGSQRTTLGRPGEARWNLGIGMRTPLHTRVSAMRRRAGRMGTHPNGADRTTAIAPYRRARSAAVEGRKGAVRRGPRSAPERVDPHADLAHARERDGPDGEALVAERAAQDVGAMAGGMHPASQDRRRRAEVRRAVGD